MISIVCIDCGTKKPLTAYALSNVTRTGRAQPCKDCFNIRARRRYREIHPEPPPFVMPTTMVCNVCGDEKPLREFHVAPARRSGHTQPCKACMALAQQERVKRDPETFKAQKNAWNAAHPEAARLRSRRWQQNNPLKVSVHRQTRRARKRALPDHFTAHDKIFMLTYWHYACATCGNQEGFFWTLADDHFIPLTASDCPGTVATNILPLCHGQGGCNNNKRNHEPITWLMRRFGVKQGQRLLQRIQAYFTLVRQRQTPAKEVID